MNRNSIQNNVFGSLNASQMKQVESKALSAPKIRLCSSFYTPSREIVPISEFLVAFDTKTNSIIKFVAGIVPRAEFNKHSGMLFLINRDNPARRQNPKKVYLGIRNADRLTAAEKVAAWEKDLVKHLSEKCHKLTMYNEPWVEEKIQKYMAYNEELSQITGSDLSDDKKIVQLEDLAAECGFITDFLQVPLDYEKLPWSCATAEYRVLRAYRRDIRSKTRFELLNFTAPKTGIVDKKYNMHVIWSGNNPPFDVDKYIKGFFDWTRYILKELSNFTGTDITHNLTIYNRVMREETPDVAAEMLHDHSEDTLLLSEPEDGPNIVSTDTIVQPVAKAASEEEAASEDEIDLGAYTDAKVTA
jgi:hypothetical protein